MKSIQVQIIIYYLILNEAIPALFENVHGAGLKSSKKDMCKNNDKCIMKCCAVDKYVTLKTVGNVTTNIKTCAFLNNKKEVIDLDADFAQVFVKKPKLSDLQVNSEIFRVNKTFRTESSDITGMGLDVNFHLNEDGELLLETPNAYDRWVRVKNSMFCLDSIIVDDEHSPGSKTVKPGIWVLEDNKKPEEVSRVITNHVMTAGMLVSCFFLLLVLIVYGVLPELRNLFGLILIAYVTNLLGAFLLLAVMRITTHESSFCEGLTYLIYFFFLASFCWMNVMSYDIWWTFRGYAKARPIHRRGENFKFLMYCLYAFGLPVTMTIMLGVLNHVNLRHMPGFVTPKIPMSNCFIEGGEKLLYLYIPMLILILCNWTFYILTAFNLWRLSRETAVLDSEASGTAHAHRTNRHRFILYLKLSIVMGLNWTLELVSYSYTNSVVWFISDCYNILLGVAIFLIFVCKRKILKKLMKRFTSGKNSKWYPTQDSSSKAATSTCDSSATQESQTVTVPLDCYTKTETLVVVAN